MQEDFEAEKAARHKAEKQKRDLGEVVMIKVLIISHSLMLLVLVDV